MSVDPEEINLNKWPACIVVGQPVTVDQAAEILIRTDSHLPDFYFSGNDKLYCQSLSELFGLTEMGNDRYKVAYSDRVDALCRRLRKLDLEYLANNSIVSCWIGGPKGWCNWDGHIGCHTFNLGKWPSAQTVLNDWQKIARAFPFLDLQCQLCNYEAGYTDQVPTPGPLVLYTIKDGAVKIEEQTPGIHKELCQTAAPDFSVLDDGGEIGISIEDLTSKLCKLYGRVPQLDEKPA